MKQPTKTTAKKVLEVLSYGLSHGLGKPIPGQMCVEAAVCFAMGLPHSDKPTCVSGVVRSFKIPLNDGPWSSDQARAKGLRRIAVAQLGSDTIDEQLFARELALATIRKIVPLALATAAKLNPSHAEALKSAAGECEKAEDLGQGCAAARAAADAADAARAAADADAADADAADADAAANAAANAAYAARAAADAADAARAAADAAAADAAAADAAADAAYAARDEVLSLMAECGVQALIKCGSKGAQWLDLCEK